MKQILILIFAICLFSNCSKDDSNNDVNIRLSNVTDMDFENIIVNTTNYGNLKSNQVSEYKNFNKAYRYAYVELNIGEETYIIQPIDYVGETPLTNGNYTYQLDLVSYNEGFLDLTITLIEE
ncbi:hypothetical protein SAMN04488009_1594 [Maribacter sedimenticola]|uniref:DUF4377 domain-containing protein n=1 Tax=Maribacter sedimenticola TaxID=228956 RepID=A0ABY1SFR9_9FLAO|nr:hypothetical protein [Maribacter sedimenticola]SNR42495.1 hypothetical protein SAMN04488009_1594 [Maribacter sedimenticola]